MAPTDERYQETTYSFGPKPTSGFVLGLRMPQIVGFVISGALALSMLRLGGVGGLFAGIIVVAIAATIFAVPIAGNTPEQWTPILVRFVLGGLRGERRFRAQLGQVGHVVGIPEGGLEPQPVHEPKSAPAEVADLQLLEAELAAFAGAPMGAIKDTRAKTFTAVLQCQGSAFELLDPEEREHRLADYGSALAALTRDGSPIRRVSWYERTVPGDRDALAGYMQDAMRPGSDLANPAKDLVSYLQLLGRTGAVNQDHQLLFTIQIDSLRPGARKAIARMGKGDIGALAVLATEVDHVVRALEDAGISVVGVLTRRGIAAAIRDGYDPWGRLQRERTVERGPHRDAHDGISPATAGPMSRDEHLGHIEADGALHCTLWVAEWPRIDVRALFLQPLLMSTDMTRSVSMIMELVGPDKAIRSAERASTEAATEQALREKAGQRTTRRHMQREKAAMDRERELTEGHAAIRYAAYVSVSVPNDGPDAEDELEKTVQAISMHAKQASLRLERMYGQQAEAFTYTLPLGRGLS